MSLYLAEKLRLLFICSNDDLKKTLFSETFRAYYDKSPIIKRELRNLIKT